MGWRFRKVWGVGPFRWTLSKKGVGWSVGLPGMRYGISPTGQRYVSIGIPGTGMYWIKYFPARQRRQVTGYPQRHLPNPTNPPTPTPPPGAATSPPPAAPPAGASPHRRWWQQKGLGP